MPADITPYEGGFSSVSSADLISSFTISAVNVGKLVMIVPTALGTVSSINQAGAGEVLNQFTVIPDGTNNRDIYVSISTVTPQTYKFKFTF